MYYTNGFAIFSSRGWLNRNFRARTLYDGVPVPNKDVWSTARMKVSSPKGMSNQSTIQGMGWCPSSVRRGHQGADVHNGTITVPSSWLLRMWGITFGIKNGGGNTQLFSPIQLTVNTSTTSVHGFSHLPQNEVFAGSCMMRIYRLCEGPIIFPWQQNMLGLTCNRPHAPGVEDSRPLSLGHPFWV